MIMNHMEVREVSVASFNNATVAYQGSGQEAATVKKQTASYEPKQTVNYEEENLPKIDNQQSQKSGEEVQNATIKRAVEEMKKKFKNSEVVFGVHEDTNRMTIKIVDKESREVLREYPPEENLDMIAKVWELAGLLVDEKR